MGGGGGEATQVKTRYPVFFSPWGGGGVAQRQLHRGGGAK